MAVYYLAIIGSSIITYIIFSIKQSHISQAIWFLVTCGFLMMSLKVHGIL